MAADEYDAKDKGYGSVLERLNQFDLDHKNSLIIHGLHIKETDVNLIGEKMPCSFTIRHQMQTTGSNDAQSKLDTLTSGLGTDLAGKYAREGKKECL